MKYLILTLFCVIFISPYSIAEKYTLDVNMEQYDLRNFNLNFGEDNQPWISQEQELRLQMEPDIFEFRNPTDIGGGGGEFKVEIREAADNLFKRLLKKNVDENIVKELQRSFDNAEIMLVSKLYNRKGIPLQVEEGVGWSWPGVLQLKSSKWKDAFNKGINYDHHLFHEITRLSKKYSSSDPSYAWSRNELKLHENDKVQIDAVERALSHNGKTYERTTTFVRQDIIDSISPSVIRNGYLWTKLDGISMNERIERSDKTKIVRISTHALIYTSLAKKGDFYNQKQEIEKYRIITGTLIDIYGRPYNVDFNVGYNLSVSGLLIGVSFKIDLSKFNLSDIYSLGGKDYHYDYPNTVKENIANIINWNTDGTLSITDIVIKNPLNK